MIVVNNTKELELNYDLDKIPDYESVVVLGGLSGKEKYNDKHYIDRVTYPARQIKQIINQMQEIENSIPEEWNKWQRAKYIYEKLGENISYNFDREDYKTSNPSNLSVLLSRKGVCAGYSLLFKEMMDRQSIDCDYIRGRGVTGEGHSEKHAWNALQIDGYTFSVDLTWDSARLQAGNKDLEYFGCKEDFYETHKQDYDEKNYRYSTFSKESINSINTQNNIIQKELTEEEKKDIIKLAIRETYNKFKISHGKDIAKINIENAIVSYIKEGNAIGFTRQNNARNMLQQNISQDDMIEILLNEYIQNSSNNTMRNDILGNAVKETMNKYGPEFIKLGLKNYLVDNNTIGFTRQNNARQNIEEFMSQDMALETIISEFVQNEVLIKNETEKLEENDSKKYFYAEEFASVQLPKEKEGNLIRKVLQKIKEKTRGVQKGQEQMSIKSNRTIKKEIEGRGEK